ncbi:zinc-binding dehydrogenase family protein [Mycobacterium xenopi 4042]|uniref:Zinc-binding dehydrogenase family protein n=1 Tax=Mycobacterium xenopi 4042 TaxID=1299334 RepID=X7YJP1_MYCXE|nr:zinc-binding dehydrogenase family protein [Mycobacterium xenopi 4042]
MVMADGFKDAVRELTGGRGVDIVVDPVGGDRVTDSLRSLAPGGRLLVVGFTAGDISTVKLNRLLLNNLDAVGVGWVHGRWRIRVIWPAVVAAASPAGVGRRCPAAAGSLSAAAAAEAIAALENRTAKGKVVLKMRD